MGRKKIKESNPKKDEVELDKAAIDRVAAKPTFEYFDRPQVGDVFFLFKERGEELSGQVVSHAITNVRRNSSYAIKTESGRVVEVFANRLLHKQLRYCFLQQVRIVYIGREHNNWGHARKIFRVYKQYEGESGELSLVVVGRKQASKKQRTKSKEGSGK